MSSLRLVSERQAQLARVIPFAPRESRGLALQRELERLAAQRQRFVQGPSDRRPTPPPPAPTTPGAA